MRLRSVAGVLLTAALLSAPLTRADGITLSPEISSDLKGGSADGRARSYYLYCLSQQAMLRRDYAEALRLLEDATRADLNSSALAMELARVYLNLEEPRKALVEAERAVSLDPKGIEPKRLLVEAYRLNLAREEPISDSLFDRAVAAHKDLLAADPNDGDTRLGLARVFMVRGLAGPATEVLREQMRLEPASAEGAYLLGQTLFQSGAVGEARAILEEACRLHPQYAELRRALAEVVEADGDLEGAAAILTDLVAYRPEQTSYRFALAELLARMGRHAQAAQEASSLIKALSNREPGGRQEGELRAAHLLLIDSLAAENRTEAALEAVLRAEGQFPAEVRYRLKRAEVLLLEGRDAEAGAVLEALSMLSGPSRPTPAAISEVYLRAGARREEKADLPRAESLLRRAVEIDPANDRALNYLGYMLADRGVRVEEGLGFVRKALDLSPDNGAYLDSLGWALFRLGRREQAREPLERAARLMPEEPVIHDHLGDLYIALGMTEDAIRAWNEAIRLRIKSAEEVRLKILRASSKKSP